MKQFITILFLFLFSNSIFAQATQTNDLIRVQSDNGEFSIEVPKDFNYFFNKGDVSEADSLRLRNMNLLTAYKNKTLISFEIYEEKKSTLDSFYDSDKNFFLYRNDKYIKEDSELNEIKKADYTIRQITRNKQDIFLIRQYFHSKNFIYILTAISKDGENKTIRHFLDSLIFSPKTKDAPISNSLLLSSLPISKIDLATKSIKPAENSEILKLNADNGKDSILLALKPRPAYVTSARQNQIQGTIRLRVTFSENGFTPKIEVVDNLHNGLLQQTIFAVLRMKFLPEEKDGKPISTQRVVEYKFTLY